MTASVSPTAGSSEMIVRRREAGLHLTQVRRAKLCEFHMTLVPLPGETFTGVLGRLRALVREHGAVVIRLQAFGAIAAYASVQEDLRALCGALPGPVIWAEGAACSGGEVAGVHALAVSGVDVQPIWLRDQLIGYVYEDGSVRHYFMGGLGPDDRQAAPEVQTEQTYARLEAGLNLAGMDMSHVIRTWFFIDHILDWYGEFNTVRTAAFERHGIFRKLVPASTGIGASNPAGNALVLGARAMQSLTSEAKVQPVLSPLQCPAPAYGSSFSRAVEVNLPPHRHLLISGTASIEPGGQTVHVGDFGSQVDLTMRVVEAIMESRGVRFADTTRGTAYFRRAEDLSVYQKYAAEKGLRDLPLICMRADVCRDDLLFEIELDAIVPITASSPDDPHRAP